MVFEGGDSLRRAKVERRGHSQHQIMMLEFFHSVDGQRTISPTKKTPMFWPNE
jgi:hypothetical protein